MPIKGNQSKISSPQDIQQLDSDSLISEFEKWLSNGAGCSSVPLIWIRQEIKKRLSRQPKT